MARTGEVEVSRWAPNRYRQFRLTYTEEANGRASYRVYAKPLGAGWTEAVCIVSGSDNRVERAESAEQVASRLIHLLGCAFPALSHE